MSKSSLGFILAGILWLMVGVTLGVLFLIAPSTRALRSVHAHINLVGFMAFFVVGVGFHVLPRFRGRPTIHSEKLAQVQLVLANFSLAGLLVTMGLDAYGQAMPTAILATFGSLLALSFYLFFYNLWRSIV